MNKVANKLKMKILAKRKAKREAEEVATEPEESVLDTINPESVVEDGPESTE